MFVMFDFFPRIRLLAYVSSAFDVYGFMSIYMSICNDQDFVCLFVFFRFLCARVLGHDRASLFIRCLYESALLITDYLIKFKIYIK